MARSGFPDAYRNARCPHSRPTQNELAAKVGIGQPAVSMMLNRACRPQRKTVIRFAEVLEVAPQDLWPGIQQ